MRKFVLFSVAFGLSFPSESYSFTKKEGTLKSDNLTNVLLSSSAKSAIQNTVQGTVTDGKGPVSEVSVSVVGGNASTKTDAQGHFKITAAVGSKLRFSSVGYVTREVPVTSNLLNVTLVGDQQTLDEVVVTALGIERSKKNLTYSVQKVTGDDLRKSNQGNIVNALQGQVAGAQISSSGGSPGLPSEIILRGSTSLSGDNQPLMIIDGIRVSNASINGSVNRLADFNPDDIEDISILKGAAAAALYGIDAASGAIVITTKKGKAGVMQINAGYKAFVETMGRLPRQQNIYTTGTGGTYSQATTSSWGRKFRSDEAIYDNLERFFQTGVTHDAVFNVNGGADKFNYYMSGNYRNQGSMIPNTDNDKFSYLIKGTAKLLSNLELTASANYIKNNLKEGLVGGSSGGWINSILRYPLAYDILDYQYENGDPHYAYFETGKENEAIISPMWSVMNNPRFNNTERTVINGNLVYKPLNWINLNYRIGQDYFNQSYKYAVKPGTPGENYTGYISQSNGNYKNFTQMLNATFDRKFLEDFRTTLLLGGTEEYYEAKSIAQSGTGFLNPDLVSINNIDPTVLKTTESNPRRRRYALYGDFRLEYRNLLTLGITGRNDWTSTLSEENRQFFSPSYSGSFTYSELFENKNDWYGKLRVSYAKVGKDAPIYATNTNLIQNPGLGGGFIINSTGGNPYLKPERTTEFEIGTELRMLKNRLSVDFAYYNKKSIDQIITARVPLPTGYVIQTFNAGSLRNKGIEVSVSGSPVKKENFEWKSTVNAWKNNSKMLEFPGQITTFPYTNAQLSAGKAASVLGEPVLGIVGTDYKRTEEGYVIVGEDGLPVIESGETYIGNREPEFNIGWINNFRYKSFSLSFLWDFRFGGDILNASRQQMMSSGIAYDIGEWRDKEFVFDGVVEQADGSYVKNAKSVTLDYNYFVNNYAAVGTNFIEKVNWARLRYVTLSYNLPKAFTNRYKLGNVALEFSAQNPLIFTNYSGGDPEVNSAGPNAGGTGASTMGVDYGAIPLPKSYSFGINFTF
ncbi:SusC/RagA family TonB-linked outer membrane protein [Sphingobacterium siyangense]|uniref:TonB-linked SusC/RagA family outer membrane protein n=1 Tax=Sphingobacterium siyangense TaxID=459529 RepID=A0A562MCF2_9SPHI|nr:SusC/RagA family TonB-linked outer membrane protein [Sphingobacterium siyangense]TWI17522.1 TonB-linked SusC/RagA family outer membrane protein [Sphingobacterium siyangense]